MQVFKYFPYDLHCRMPMQFESIKTKTLQHRLLLFIYTDCSVYMKIIKRQGFYQFSIEIILAKQQV
jgi:hypothetical protein